MQVRRVTQDDRAWIAEVVVGAFASTRVVSRGRVHDDATMLDGFVVENDGRPVGCALWSEIDGDAELVVIVTTYRGAGAGTALLDAVVDHARAHGWKRLWLITTNDNWKDSQKTEIDATGSAPGDDREAVIIATLTPGQYTGLLTNKLGTPGIGTFEVYDLSFSADSELANISTRGTVLTGNNVMIAGVILGGGTGTNRILVRALGPSLSQFGVSNPLTDPTLGLVNSQGTLLGGNDNWKQTQEADIRATGIAPSDDPLLSARSAVYSHSFTRRAGEAKQPSAITPADVRKGE